MGRAGRTLVLGGGKGVRSVRGSLRKLMAKFNTEQMLDHFVDNVASPFGGMQDTLGGMVALAVTLVATILMTKDYALLQEQIKKNTFGQVVVSLAKRFVRGRRRLSARPGDHHADHHGDLYCCPALDGQPLCGFGGRFYRFL